MTEAEKAAKYDEIARKLWGMALAGNLLQATVAAALIRTVEIEGPDGESPEEA